MSEASWLAIYLPRLSTDRVIRAGRAPNDKPLAIFTKQTNAYVLTDANQPALAVGIRPGMPLADARAIYPGLVTLEAEPEDDARLLDSIAAWCERFTPIVVIDAPHGLFLDITGCGHLFGDNAALCAALITRLRAQGFSARAAIAQTPGAAWAIARFGADASPQSGERLDRLPVEALRLNEEAAALLRRLGLKTIGQLMDAPRASFTARAGQHAMLRLDQALGRAPEALSPRRPPPPVFALRRFLEPLFSVDMVLIATQRLCEDALAKLDVRGAGARRCILHLFGVDGRDRSIDIGVSRPVRDANVLMRLFREKLAIAAENLDAEFGIEAARLDVAHMERIEGAAPALVADDDALASAEKISGIVDVVSARLGAKRVLRGKLRDTHTPEAAGAWEAAQKPERAPLPNLPAQCPSNGASRRPLTLFTRAQPIDAIATVPDGPPIRFRWRRVLREVARAEGPERFAGDWLANQPTRDFYRVEDKQGRRYWLYREGLYGEVQTPRWFVAGLFA